MDCINGCMVRSNLVISLVPYLYPKMIRHNRSHATSYVRVVIETYLGAMQYVKTRSVHMDSEVHLAEGRSGNVSRSYQVQLTLLTF